VAASDDNGTNQLVAHTLRAEGFDASEDGTGRGTPLVPVAWTVSAQSNGFAWTSEVHPTIQAHPSSDTSDRQSGVLVPVAFDGMNQAASETHPSLRVGRDSGDCVAIGMNWESVHHEECAHDVQPTLKAGSAEPAVLPRDGMAVRRITPEEAEALQGFPRGYTAVPYRGKLAADGPRYKALGNSMAVPVMSWLGQRIAAVEALTADRREVA
jgi:DNA (cytosine-5)-methyltransferase 1